MVLLCGLGLDDYYGDGDIIIELHDIIKTIQKIKTYQTLFTLHFLIFEGIFYMNVFNIIDTNDNKYN